MTIKFDFKNVRFHRKIRREINKKLPLPAIAAFGRADAEKTPLSHSISLLIERIHAIVIEQTGKENEKSK